MTQASGHWNAMRELMPVAQRFAYFDHAAVAPLPAPARDAVLQWVQEATELGDTVWNRWSEEVERVRQQAAALIGAGSDEIGFVGNTTTAISLVAEGYPWQAGDNVVTAANEFPSNLYPWMNLASRGVATRRVPVTGVAIRPEDLLGVCDDRTRIISISWVGYATGWRLDIERLVEQAHRRNILVLLDAIQGLGLFPLDVQQTKIDFLAADGHKWLLGPEGAALLYIRREHLDRLRPLGVGWHSVIHAHDFSHIELKLRPAAARYEGGSQNMVGVLALGASLRMLAQFGLNSQQSPLAERVAEITELACERLSAIGARIVSDRRPPHRSGIVAFELPGQDPLAVKRQCLQQGVVLTCRHGWLRLSPHAYVNEQDVDRLLEALAEGKRQNGKAKG